MKTIEVASEQEFELYHFLKENFPFSSESEIQSTLWGYNRANSYQSNKKYADRLRRALRKGLIARVHANPAHSQAQYFYYVPRQINVVFKYQKHAIKYAVAALNIALNIKDINIDRLFTYTDKLSGSGRYSVKIVGRYFSARHRQIIKKSLKEVGYELENVEEVHNTWSHGTRFWIEKQF